MNNIDLHLLSQKDIFAYYLGYYKCAMATESESRVFSQPKDVALVCFTKTVAKSKNNVRHVEVEEYKYNSKSLSIIYLPVDVNHLQKRIDYVYDNYAVVGLFNLLDTYIVGQKVWLDFAETGTMLDVSLASARSHWEQSQKLQRWSYSFYVGSDNLTPPLFPPTVPLLNTDILKACSMNLPSGSEVYSSMDVGKNLNTSACIKVHSRLGHRNSEFVELIATRPGNEDYYSLPIAFLEELTGKTFTQIIDEKDKWCSENATK